MQTVTVSKPLNFNLDCPNDVAEFIAKYGHNKRRRLANMLGLSGRGSAKIANLFSGYAWNKVTAIELRLDGNIAEAMRYEAICDRIYSQIPEEIRPW